MFAFGGLLQCLQRRFSNLRRQGDHLSCLGCIGRKQREIARPGRCLQSRAWGLSMHGCHPLARGQKESEQPQRQERLPLEAQVNEMKFKVNFLDVGLMQNACGLQAELTLTNDFIQINSGAVTEQFIGQELRAHSDSYLKRGLFFWARDKKNSSAEVDYVMAVDSLILPVEVKAGKTGTLKSLKLFIEEKKSLFGVRFSQEKLSLHDKVLTLPLYMAEQMRRLAREAQ